MQEQRHQKTLWEDYWLERHSSLQNPQGKRRAVTNAFRLVKALAMKSTRDIRILELGCGDGHILGELLKLCAANKIPIQECVGIDNQAGAIENARRLYPDMCFSVADYANQPLDLQPFNLVMLVGTLHEVYSSKYSTTLREIDRALGKSTVQKALSHGQQLIGDDGYLVLFDGLEHSLTPEFKITTKFESVGALEEFKKFAAEYEAFRIDYEELTDDRIRISIHDFTRYITKTRFINTNLWEIEKRESYQYFNEVEFRNSLNEIGLKIVKIECSSPHLHDWQNRVRIETSGVDFPKENILIVGRKTIQTRGGDSLMEFKAVSASARS